MKRGKIEITGSMVHIELGPDGQVWMSRWQLADLFGVYIQTITANIKAIITSSAVRPSMDSIVIMSGQTPLPELYSIDMIIALAFRINSPAADRIRRYVVQRMAVETGKPALQIFLSCGAGAAVN